VDLSNVNKLKKAEEIRRGQFEFVTDIYRLKETEVSIWYMDETTVNRWLTKRKTWTTEAAPITLPM